MIAVDTNVLLRILAVDEVPSEHVGAAELRRARGGLVLSFLPGQTTSEQAPPMLPSDTDPRAARVQVEVWRRMGPEGRSRAAAALSESLLRTVRDQVAAAHPDWTPRQVTLALIARLHGPDLAARANGGVPVPVP